MNAPVPPATRAWPAEGADARSVLGLPGRGHLPRASRQRIFRGATWKFLGLEAELPDAGDFKTTFVGDMPVVVTRDATARCTPSRTAARIAARCSACKARGNAEGDSPASTTTGPTTSRQPHGRRVPPRHQRQGRHARGREARERRRRASCGSRPTAA